MSKVSICHERMIYVAVAALVAGCGTTPSTVQMPQVVSQPPGKKNNDFARYKVKDRKGDDKDLNAHDGAIMPVEKTIGGVKAQIWAHQIAWRNEQTNLSQGMDGLNNTQFGGVVLSALGAVASNLDVTKVGAGVAGGAGIWGNHYQLTVQADNYKLASDAMECLYQRVDALPTSFWSATYYQEGDNTGVMRLPRGEYAAGSDAKAAGKDVDTAYDTLRDLFITINTRVNNVRERLIIAQSKVKFATPSATDIQAALMASNQADAQAGESAKAMKKAAVDQIPRFDALYATLAPEERSAAKSAVEAFAKLSPETIKQALKLPAELTTCTKLIGG